MSWGATRDILKIWLLSNYNKSTLPIQKPKLKKTHNNICECLKSWLILLSPTGLSPHIFILWSLAFHNWISSLIQQQINCFHICLYLILPQRISVIILFFHFPMYCLTFSLKALHNSLQSITSYWLLAPAHSPSLLALMNIGVFF